MARELSYNQMVERSNKNVQHLKIEIEAIEKSQTEGILEMENWIGTTNTIIRHWRHNKINRYISQRKC